MVIRKIGKQKWRLYSGCICLLLISVVLIGGIASYVPAQVNEQEINKTGVPDTEEACKNLNGILCGEHEYCNTKTIELEGTDRCCPKGYVDTVTQFDFSTKRICGRNPETGKFNYCHCEPNNEKNKIAVIIAKNGVYDSDVVTSQILEYFNAVKKDLNTENAGIRKFEGKTMNELDDFTGNLYTNENVGYIILIGDDLPVAETTEDSIQNLADIQGKLACANKDCELRSCKDMAISYILPPVLYSSSQKTDFVSNVLEKYADYHNNFAIYNNTYQKSVISINDAEFSIRRNGYELPTTDVFNNESGKINDEFKKKNMVLLTQVHGASTTMGLGLGNTVYTTLEDYSDFAKINGAPALLFDASSCQSVTIRQTGINYCCWPQITMESGIWAYYSIGGETEMQGAFAREETIGLALRKEIVQQSYIFGDVLAHVN
ncbi:MAG: hypothetical protein V1887_03620 [Candidatus Aenigmatarchaeota archaeon]